MRFTLLTRSDIKPFRASRRTRSERKGARFRLLYCSLPLFSCSETLDNKAVCVLSAANVAVQILHLVPFSKQKPEDNKFLAAGPYYLQGFERGQLPKRITFAFQLRPKANVLCHVAF